MKGLSIIWLTLLGLTWGWAGPTAAAEQKPFFPIGLYGVNQESSLETLSEAGFNLVVGPARSSFLDKAHTLGMSVIASPGASAGRGFDPSRFAQTVNQLDAHPALHSWYLVDEPDMTRTPPWQVEMDQRLLKAHAIRKPTSLVLFDGLHARDYGGIPDILMVDSYPIPWMPLAHFSQQMNWSRSIAGPDKPLYAILQAFDWYAFREALPRETQFRVPTHEELRCMTYLALAQPVDGLLFYTYSSGKWHLPDHPDLWHGLLEIVATLQDRPFLQGCRRLPWIPSYTLSPYEKRRSQTQEPSIHCAHLRDREGMDHVVLINTTEQPLNLSITLPASIHRWALLDDSAATPLGGFQSGSIYKIPFEKYQVRILKGFALP